MSNDNRKLLNEIKHLLGKLVGGREITFRQFTDILDKDNLTYKRPTLLDQRERFFRRKEKKRGRGSPHEIRMSLKDFVGFLDFLSKQKKPFDLARFKKAIIYCVKFGIVVGR